MRKILIDCGAHCGCTRRFFRKNFDSNYEYEIFSFEPDPEFNQFCPKLINKAVWTTETTKTFHKFDIRGGSSLNKYRADLLSQQKGHINHTDLNVQGKKLYYGKIRTAIEVECFDINKWILDNFSKEDYIVLKLDVECAEYQIIPHMISGGSMSYVNKLYIEWHNVKCNCGGKQKDAELTAKLNEMGISVAKWDAILAGYCFIRGEIKYDTVS